MNSNNETKSPEIIKYRSTVVYGNGRKEVKERAVPTKEELVYKAYINSLKSREEKKKADRIYRTRRNSKERINSIDLSKFKYWGRMSSANSELSHDRRLLNEVALFLKKQGAVYHAMIEVYDNYEKNGFHVHFFSDREIDFNGWNGFSAEENIEKDYVYFKEIETYENATKTGVESCYNYSEKMVGITKDYLPPRSRVYSSNVKKKPTARTLSGIDSNNSEHIILENSVAKNTRLKRESLIPHKKQNDQSNPELNASLIPLIIGYIYLRMSKQSNTKLYVSLIPLLKRSKTVNFTNYLLLYIGYIENIP